MQAGIRIGGEGSEERLPATLRPLERTIQSVTGRQWKVIGIGQGAGGRDRQWSKTTYPKWLGGLGGADPDWDKPTLLSI